MFFVLFFSYPSACACDHKYSLTLDTDAQTPQEQAAMKGSYSNQEGFVQGAGAKPSEIDFETSIQELQKRLENKQVCGGEGPGI